MDITEAVIARANVDFKARGGTVPMAPAAPPAGTATPAAPKP
jgi:hypothetical protein